MRKKRKNSLLFCAFMSFMVLSLAGFSTLTYAIFGYSKVTASGNTVTITSPADEQALISVSKDGTNFQESIQNAINVEIASDQSSYKSAGKIYLRNESNTSAQIIPAVNMTAGSGEEVILSIDKVSSTGPGSKPYFVGPLNDYGKYDIGYLGEIDIKPNETVTLIYSIKPAQNLPSIPGVKSYEVKFDLTFKVADDIQPL